MRFKEFLIKLINLYQQYISVLFRKGYCVFYPTCSEYTKQAINKYGSLWGCYMGAVRIMRCHPWQQDHIDPLA